MHNTEFITFTIGIVCRGFVDIPPPPRAQEPAMFDRGTRGRFLRTLSPQIRPRNQGLVLAHDSGQHRAAEKNISGVLRQGMRALSFPTINRIDK